MPSEIAIGITAAAAVVQAIAALVIVGLTVWLAVTAAPALRESARQAKVAEAALHVELALDLPRFRRRSNA